MEINFINQTESNIDSYTQLIDEILIDFEGIMNVIFVTDEEIQKINREYRNIDRITDVISFALKDELDAIDLCGIDDELGDIFICINQAERQALEYGHSIEREMGFLAVHGYLHLNGYDHMNESDEKIMFAKQDEILNKANVKR